MRPPSYYAALANSNLGTGERNSSQQWRSSFSSSSSSSYVTRTHLPYVSQSMLVAHCITGAGSTTKPYGHTTSYSRLGSNSSSISSSSNSALLRSSRSTKRYQPTTTGTIYTPRSSYLSSSYYKPARMRERPLLTQISRKIPSVRRKEHDDNKQQSACWSADVGRNISRNKYLIKFREFERPSYNVTTNRKETVKGKEENFERPSVSKLKEDDFSSVKSEVQVKEKLAQVEVQEKGEEKEEGEEGGEQIKRPEVVESVKSSKVAAGRATAVGSSSKRIRYRDYKLEDFDFLSVLGHGGWGFVILAELKEHDAYFAVKCIKKITIVEDDDLESIMIERKVLALGNINPFICKLFCTFQTQGYLFFAMEFCAGGDLMFHVQREGKFDEARCKFYAAEIICAIRFLHNRDIIYRDLKLDNILLDARGHIRLVDFGMCQCRSYRDEMLPSNFCGTPEYISPEIIKGVPYNHSVDWWSFGVLLYEMAVGKMPFRGGDENELLWNVCYEQIHYPMFLTKELSQLLQLLLEREPSKRMGMNTCKAGDIKNQAWFRGVDWKATEMMLVDPPFIPEVNSKRDVSNFDSDFTESAAELSPVNETTLAKIEQDQFQRFPYTNPDTFIFDLPG